MNKYSLTIHCNQTDVHFEYRTAARMARVSEDFICRCEQVELVMPRVMHHGKKGLCADDVCRLKMIRHLHEDLGLDLEAADFILRYRQRIRQLRRRLEDMERQLIQKEQEHLSEIMALERRLAKVAEVD